MKAILEFNLPEDNIEYKVATKANDISQALWTIIHNLKKQCIREAETNNESVECQYVIDGIDLVYEKIYELLNEYDINIDKLIE